MPNSSGSPPPNTTTDAQSSLLRLTRRRHSLPASTALSGFFSLWASDNSTVVETPPTPLNPAPNAPALSHPRSSAALNVNGNGNAAPVGGNRHRYGHRHTRSEVLDQPVVVKSYNPRPSTSSMATTLLEDDDLDKIPLPSVDSFTFDGLLKAIEPEVSQTLDAVSNLCSKYQGSVQIEVDVLAGGQAKLDSRMKDADRLANQVLKATKSRSDRLESEATGLKGGAAVDSLADAAEVSHTTLTSIISTLLAIDEMLPPQERLSPLSSAHRTHYPKVHELLADKARELNVRFGSGKPNEQHSTGGGLYSRMVNGEEGPSSRQEQKLPVWMRRQMSATTPSSSSGPSKPPSNIKRISSPLPQLQLRTILPSLDASDPHTSTGSYYPLPSKTATGISLASTATTQSETPGGGGDNNNSHRFSGGGGSWGRRPSTSTLAFFPITETTTNTNTTPKEVQPPQQQTPKRASWRNSGSWASVSGFFGGGRSSKSSGGGGGGKVPLSSSSKSIECATERLKRVLEGGGENGRSASGKGKGVVY